MDKIKKYIYIYIYIMSSNYTQYLGAKRCCDLKVQGPQGVAYSAGQVLVGKAISGTFVTAGSTGVAPKL